MRRAVRAWLSSVTTSPATQPPTTSGASRSTSSCNSRSNTTGLGKATRSANCSVGLTAGTTCSVTFDLVPRKWGGGLKMAGTVGPDEAVFRSHLAAGKLLLGASTSRWRQVLVAWPYALFAVRAAGGIEYGLRFECGDYPRRPATARPWDIERDAPLAPRTLADWHRSRPAGRPDLLGDYGDGAKTILRIARPLWGVLTAELHRRTKAPESHAMLGRGDARQSEVRRPDQAPRHGDWPNVRPRFGPGAPNVAAAPYCGRQT